MKLLPIVVFIIAFFEIKAMYKKGLKKEIVVFVVIGVTAVTYGYYYLTHKESASLVANIFSLLGIKY